MVSINKNYLNLQGSYLFSEIAKRVNKFASENPDKKIIFVQDDHQAGGLAVPVRLGGYPAQFNVQ